MNYDTMAERDTVADRLGRIMPQLILLLWVPVYIGLGMVNSQWLPPKYLFDQAHILAEVTTASATSSDSFIVMAWIYRELGLASAPALTSLITLLLHLALLALCVPWNRLATLSIVETGLLCFMGITACVYLAQYTKESVVLLVMLAVAAAPRSRWGDALIVALVCLYAWKLRVYWFLIAGLFLGLRVLLPRLRRVSSLLVVLAGCYLALAVGAELTLGVNLNAFRDLVAESRVASMNAQTAIHGYLPADNPVLAAANAALGTVFLMFPVPLVLMASPIYLAFSVVISYLWARVWLVVHRALRFGWFDDARFARAAALLIAMVCVQGVFEPDYGSYVKHLAPVFPVFMIVLLYPRSRTSEPGSPVDHGQVNQGQVDQGPVNQGPVGQGPVNQGQVGGSGPESIERPPVIAVPSRRRTVPAGAGPARSDGAGFGAAESGSFRIVPKFTVGQQSPRPFDRSDDSG